MYTLAASAAGVGVLALDLPSEAKIIYTPTHRVIAVNSRYQLDLNHDGSTDFTIHNSKSCPNEVCLLSLTLKPAPPNSAVGYKSASPRVRYESALRAGVRVGPGDVFQKSKGRMAAGDYFSTTGLFGPWADVKNRYLGLSFVIKGKRHYGWARLTVGSAQGAITATLTGYAYETIPNKPIIAGKTKGADDNAEQPATLGRLAFGRK
jgi:hypothetical protein